MKTGAKVFLGIPFYEAIKGQVVDALNNGCARESEHQYIQMFSGGSFLARNFNQLWCEALNTRKRGWSHFAMIHADVGPRSPCWLDVMVDEMERTGADLLSVVLPIKTYHGLTSTAVWDPTNGNIRRLTMHEVCAIPTKSFDAEMAGFPGQKLLASTGLWMCRFTEPWIEKVWFEVLDHIVQREDDKFDYETAVDDWLFSQKLHRLGLKVMSTKAVVCAHWGACEYRNDVPWGSLKTDDHVAALGAWVGENNPQIMLQTK